MIRHAARALPWPLLGLAAVVLVALLRIVEQWPYTMWPLEGVAVGLVAGVAAWAYDEPAAAVVDTLPRGLAWRTLARSLGVVLLLVWWLLAVAVTRDAYFGHAVDVAWQGLAATGVVVAAATAQRRRGRSRPASGLATGVVGAAAYLALARPFDNHPPVFPYTAVGPWADSRVLWSGLALGATAVLVVTLREWPIQSRPKHVCASWPRSTSHGSSRLTVTSSWAAWNSSRSWRRPSKTQDAHQGQVLPRTSALRFCTPADRNGPTARTTQK